MREVFHQSLEDVRARLVEIGELVTVAIDKATRAFSTSDVAPVSYTHLRAHET